MTLFVAKWFTSLLNRSPNSRTDFQSVSDGLKNRPTDNARKKPTIREVVERLAITAIIVLSFLASGCSWGELDTITLATTTSTRDSGLMDELLPVFQERTGIQVKMVTVGTGQALEIGRRGDADVLLTHAPDAEKQFVDEGFATGRTFVMYNDFVLVGPADDPGQVELAHTIKEAFQKIATSESLFASRHDQSGTHLKEQAIWRSTEIAAEEIAGDWYLKVGAGMGQTLRVAFEKEAYTLTDRSTFLAHKDELKLQILSEGDSILRNDYSVMLIDSQKHAHVNHAAAKQFADFLLSEECQNLIASFGVDKHGQPLFFPAGG